MGVALIVAAALFAMTQPQDRPRSAATRSSSTGWRFGVGVGGNFVLGALMTLGIGLYGPCMILVSLLGMNPMAAFPIMMGSCAFLMPVGSVRFIEKRSYALRPALGLALGGVPGGAGGRLHREAAADLRPLGRGRGRGLHRPGHAALGHEGGADASGQGNRTGRRGRPQAVVVRPLSGLSPTPFLRITGFFTLLLQYRVRFVRRSCWFVHVLGAWS